MPKVLIFGAGDGGMRVTEMLDDSYDVLAYVDNSVAKQGQSFQGKPVIAPTQIGEYAWEVIIVGNIHGRAVCRQLVEEFGVNPARIWDHYHDGLLDARRGALELVAKEIRERDIFGAIGELGVFRGDFARLLNRHFPQRKLYLFDTFEGFNAADVAIELQRQLSNSSVGEFRQSSIEAILGRMDHPSNCVIRKGYFPDTAAGLEETFAFVSIDVDLYKPTLEGLRYFYPRLARGGFIFIHDYNSTRFTGVKAAVREFQQEQALVLFPMTDLCGSLVIGK